MSYGRIYRIVNNLNGKAYIGQTIQPIHRRFFDHCNKGKNNGVSPVRSAICKYGKENFTLELVSESPDREHLNGMERYWIRAFGTLTPNGYNIEHGGCDKGTIRESTKRKLSHLYKGKTYEEIHGKEKAEQIKAKQRKNKKMAEARDQSKPCVCIETGVVYPSGKAAAEALGVSKSLAQHSASRCKPMVRIDKTLKYITPTTGDKD